MEFGNYNCHAIQIYAVFHSNGQFPYLGLVLSIDDYVLVDLNIPGRIGKFEAVLKKYKYGPLTELGRILVIKQVAVATLVYHLTMVPTPDDRLMSVFNEEIQKYMWSGRHKVNQEMLYQKFEIGGFQSIILIFKNNSLKLTWISRLFTLSESFWAIHIQDCFIVSITIVLTRL